MKNKIILLALFIICILMLVLFCTNAPNLNTQEPVIESDTQGTSFIMKSSFTPLQDEPNAWYTKFHFIAHGGGGVDGKTYTNSLEAWQHSYNSGNRVIDADLAYTADNHLVLRHNWNDNLEQTSERMENSRKFFDKNGHLQFLIQQERMSLPDFKRKKIFSKYTPMTLEDMIMFMATHEDLYVAPDMKDDVLKSYRDLVDIASKMGKIDVLNRIIVNLYRYELHSLIMEIYPWKNITLRQHHVDKRDYKELFEFCLKNQIHVLNVSSCYMNEKEIQFFIKAGIHIYVAVVDYISDMRHYKSLGASGAVSSWLTESDWTYVEGN